MTTPPPGHSHQLPLDTRAVRCTPDEPFAFRTNSQRHNLTPQTLSLCRLCFAAPKSARFANLELSSAAPRNSRNRDEEQEHPPLWPLKGRTQRATLHSRHELKPSPLRLCSSRQPPPRRLLHPRIGPGPAPELACP